MATRREIWAYLVPDFGVVWYIEEGGPLSGGWIQLGENISRGSVREHFVVLKPRKVVGEGSDSINGEVVDKGFCAG
jgi:hypothetical protein